MEFFDEEGFCKSCNWNEGMPECHILHSFRCGCDYIKKFYNLSIRCDYIKVINKETKEVTYIDY
jgi:hypothetical protein